MAFQEGGIHRKDIYLTLTCWWLEGLVYSNVLLQRDPRRYQDCTHNLAAVMSILWFPVFWGLVGREPKGTSTIFRIPLKRRTSIRIAQEPNEATGAEEQEAEAKEDVGPLAEMNISYFPCWF